MSSQTFVCRLFGGRDVGVTYDSGAGTLSIFGQSVTISSLSSALQAQWQSATGGTVVGTSSRPAFGGDNVSNAVGAILDNQPTWRTAIMSTLATFPPEPMRP
jgi:hypothetical protein